MSVALMHSTATLSLSGRRLPESRRQVPELDDATWLQRRYDESGDATIAAELGVHKRRVQAARRLHGITSHPVGPRRGVPRPAPRLTQPTPPIEGLTSFERSIIERYRADRRAAATKDLLVERIIAAHEADAAGDQLAYEDAMLSISTLAARIAEHHQQLRRAA